MNKSTILIETTESAKRIAKLSDCINQIINGKNMGSPEIFQLIGLHQVLLKEVWTFDRLVNRLQKEI